MSIVNEQTYESFSGSFVPVRDNNNNLLSITSSNIPINEESQFIELDSAYQYYSTSSFLNMVNTNFSELTITDDSELKIPTGSLIINESEYHWLLDRVLNLEEDLISSSSLFENELDILSSENTSLERTVQSVADAAITITNNLITKYEAIDQFVANDLGALKYIWYVPFNDIITNRNTRLVNRQSVYLDLSQSAAHEYGLPPTTIHRTEVSYSLAFDGLFLQDLFASYEGEALTIASLQGKIIELHGVTSSLEAEIIDLQNKLYACQHSSSGIIDPTADIGSLHLVISSSLLLTGLTESYNGFRVSIVTNNTADTQFDFMGNMSPYAQNGTCNINRLQPIGLSTIQFYKWEYIRINPGTTPVKYSWDWVPWILNSADVKSLTVLINGKKQLPYFVTNDTNLRNLSFKIKKGYETTIRISTNVNAWGDRA